MSLLASSALAVDEAFADVVYGDDEWVRSEFAALVAAAWASPPADPPDTRSLAGGQGRHQRADAAVQGAARRCTPRLEDPRLPRRQRSPP